MLSDKDINFVKNILKKDLIDPLTPDEIFTKAAPIKTDFGKFKIIRLIGKGAVGEVYHAYDNTLKRDVALKILKGAFSQDIERFHREATLAARLNHPNIVQVYEIGEIEGKYYICMQHIEGDNPDPRELSLKQILKITAKIANALSYAHDMGIIHRDIKPSNIIIDRKGEPYLTDFGIAKQLTAEKTSTLSVEGMIIGTPAFMSPEQAKGEIRKVDKLSDIYGLGATLYYLITGREPFSAENVTEIINKVINEDPVEPRKFAKDIPREVEAIISKAMRKERQKRYQSAREFAEDIKRYFEGEPLIAKPVSQITRFLKKARKQGVKVSLSLFLLAITGLLIFLWLNKIKTEKDANLLLKAENSINEFDKQLFLPPEDITKKYYLLDEAIKNSQDVKGKTNLHLAYYQIARAYTRKGELQKGLEYINKAIELSNDPEHIFERVMIYIKLHQKSYIEYSETQSRVYKGTPYVDLINSDFKRISDHKFSGWKYIFAVTFADLHEQKPIKEVIQRLQSSIEIEQSSVAKAELLTLEGIIYHYFAMDLINAIKSFEEVINLKRCDYDSYIYLARAYNEAINYFIARKVDFTEIADKSIKILATANKIKPDSLETWLCLSYIYGSRAMFLYGSGRDAGEEIMSFLHYFEKLIKQDQRYVKPWINFAVLCTSKERYLMGLKIDSSDIYDQFIDLVTRYIRNPDDLFMKMINYCENSRQGLSDISANYHIGLIYMLKGIYKQSKGDDSKAEFSKALEHFDKSLSFAHTFASRARVYNLMKDYGAAIVDWQRLALLEPQFKDFAQLMINHAKEKMR